MVSTLKYINSAIILEDKKKSEEDQFGFQRGPPP